MAKAKLKTEKTQASVSKFLSTVDDAKKKKDSQLIAAMMKAATGEDPKMWGTAIVGFGSKLLKYDSGRELDWFTIGFSPRKNYIALYGILRDGSAGLLKKLGKHKTGKGCLYINDLEDVDAGILKKLLENAAGK